ncbi:RNA polymerase sigma factor [Sphingomonas sp. LM7]|uniref:RNA polymerase sigma factor n=1 Tax=Sphingomonas sp. LM7 TaxID=1938607 RepID=UPI001559D991|nr:sigma-70 family RNA polymerase sigma factor [Sphingomonas sp. LM7]
MSQSAISFDDVIRSHSGLLSRIALAYEADPSQREDLKQEIVLAVWRALPSFRGQSSLKTYVASIAQKRAVTHVSRRVRSPVTEELDEELPTADLQPDEAAIVADRRARLLAAMRELSVAQRETATLMLEGFSFIEIGETLGITANAAMLRCQRAKASLVEHMGAAHGR